MAKAAVLDINLGDIKQSFSSVDELQDYIKKRIMSKLQEAATEIFNLPQPRALGQDFQGDFVGLWKEDQQLAGRSVEVSIGVTARF